MRSVIVLFEVNVKSGKMQDYLQMAGALKDSLAKAEGFIRSERFSSLAAEGKILSLSVMRFKMAQSCRTSFGAELRKKKRFCRLQNYSCSACPHLYHDRQSRSACGLQCILGGINV